MQRKAVVRLGKAREQPVGDHRLGAPAAFLGRLPDEHQGAAPLVLQVEHDLGDRHPYRHVDVVAAGMHHRRFFAAPDLRRLAGVGQPGLLRQRQGVEVGADHDRGAGPVLGDRHDAGPAHALGHLIAQRPHLGSELGRRPGFLEAEFGVGVDILVEGIDPGILRIEAAGDRGTLAGCVHRAGRDRQAQGDDQGKTAAAQLEPDARHAFPLLRPDRRYVIGPANDREVGIAGAVVSVFACLPSSCHRAGQIRQARRSRAPSPCALRRRRPRRSCRSHRAPGPRSCR